GELLAILIAMHHLADDAATYGDVKRCEIVSDSMYAIKSISEWGPRWLRTGGLDDKKNLDLILPAIELHSCIAKTHDVKFVHMRSHRPQPQSAPELFMWRGNDICDKLCQYNLGV